MRFVLWCSIPLLAGRLFAQVAPTDQAITPALLSGHVHALAHDSLEGRATGSVGEEKAARYVARTFARLGLRPVDSSQAVGPDAYFQPYTIHQRGWGEVYLQTAHRRYRLYEDFYVNGLPDVPIAQTVGVTFAGYGIDAPTYSDYDGIDVRGKAVVLWEGEPRTSTGRYLVSGTDRPSRWSDDAHAWQRKVRAAKQRGALYVLIISGERGGAFRPAMNHRRAMNGRLSKLSLEPIAETPTELAAFVISDSLAQDVLGVSLRQLARWQRRTDEQTVSPARLMNRTLDLRSHRQNQPIATRNVLGWIAGTEHSDEVIVVSAHLDHLGKSAGGVIYNGADDDASGIAGVLAVAQAIVQSGKRPRRSILFAVFTGEELGLLGSNHYVSHPRWPLAQTVCNLNIDMIGRADSAHLGRPAYVYALGSDRLSAELRQLHEAVNNERAELTLDYRFDRDDPQELFSRSDHYNFARFDIPVIHYFTGFHPDYHQPTDDADRLLYDQQAAIVRLIFRTTWAVANRPLRIRPDRP